MKSELDQNILETATIFFRTLPIKEQTTFQLIKLTNELKKLAYLAYDHGATDALWKWKL